MPTHTRKLPIWIQNSTSKSFKLLWVLALACSFKILCLGNCIWFYILIKVKFKWKNLWTMQVIKCKSICMLPFTTCTCMEWYPFLIILPLFFNTQNCPVSQSLVLMAMVFIFSQERQPSTSGGPKHVHGQQQAHQQPGDQL